MFTLLQSLMRRSLGHGIAKTRPVTQRRTTSARSSPRAPAPGSQHLHLRCVRQYPAPPSLNSYHRHIKENVWLLDPRWHLLGDEVRLEDLGIEYEPEPDVGVRMDYLFAMQPSAPSHVDEILVVEIKRARTNDGRVHRVSASEVTKFQDYLNQAEQVYVRDEHPPQVSGIMIADGFSGPAWQRSRMQIPGVCLHYRTWARVIRETERLHRGWLAVATRRADSTERDVVH